MGTRHITSWLKTEDGRLAPFWWLRFGISVVVLVVILFWIMLVPLNSNFWMVRETASLPVAKHHSGMVDRGMQIEVKIDQSGRLFIADRGITKQEFDELLEKAKTDVGGGHLFHVEIRVDAKTAWRHVQPVLMSLRAKGYYRPSFLTRDKEGRPSYVEAHVVAPPTNTQVTILQSGGTFTINGKPYSAENLRRFVLQLGEFDRLCPVHLVSDSKSSVQDVVDVISMCSQIFNDDTVYLGDNASLEIVGGVQQAPSALR